MLYRQILSDWPRPDELVVGAAGAEGLLSDPLSSRITDAMTRMQVLDVLTFLPDQILTKIARASMAVGLEARVPLLGHRVVAFALGLRRELKIRAGVSKGLLRRVRHRHVPPELAERPTQGFSVLLAHWLGDRCGTATTRPDCFSSYRPIQTRHDARLAVAGRHDKRATAVYRSSAWHGKGSGGNSNAMIRLSTAALLVASCGPPAVAVEAFPGAQGFGAGARGGRGGTVHEIVNLNDAGPGSLRACVEASGPRTCVFRVGGTIELSSPVVARAPYLTIAGQTAPGDGIALRLAHAPTRPGSLLVIADVDDVVIRHIRLRPGPSSDRASTDALTIQDSHDVIVDHVSMSWAPDENLGMGGAVQNFTAQWSIMAEGLRPHSKGTLACGPGWNCTNVTLHRNLYVSNRDRNPELNGAAFGHFDVVNNVMHNPKSEYVEVWSTWGGTLANIVGNTFRMGPNTNSWAHGLRYHDHEARGFPLVYMADNASDVPLLAPGTAPHVVRRPVATLSIAPEAAAAAYDEVLAQAGAWPRDAVDARLVAEVRNRRGRIIARPAEVGGWPNLASGIAPTDADHDGMPDDWERTHGLDPDDPDDRNGDRDRDGYTNLEEYLNQLAASLVTVSRSEAVGRQR